MINQNKTYVGQIASNKQLFFDDYCWEDHVLVLKDCVDNFGNFIGNLEIFDPVNFFVKRNEIEQLKVKNENL